MGLNGSVHIMHQWIKKKNTDSIRKKIAQCEWVFNLKLHPKSHVSSCFFYLTLKCWTTFQKGHKVCRDTIHTNIPNKTCSINIPFKSNIKQVLLKLLKSKIKSTHRDSLWASSTKIWEIDMICETVKKRVLPSSELLPLWDMFTDSLKLASSSYTLVWKQNWENFKTCFSFWDIWTLL